MENRKEAERRAELAYEWIQENTWEKICQQWLNVFNKATNKARTARKFKAQL